MYENIVDQNKSVFLRSDDRKPIIIAGPCSAESEEQVLQTAHELKEGGKVQIFRSGIWKPRTTPGNFEGVGKKGLAWLRKVKDETGLLTTTEVATPQHVESILRCETCVDIIWIGARTTANPFSVQALADSLEGVNIPVMVKNPLNPDVKLWAGAIERIMKAGITDIAAIHRGFYPFEKSNLRNIPKWEIIFELKSMFPEIPLINDPSHIAGNKEYIREISQKALNLNMDGLMIETHINPKVALSDAEQQLTPGELLNLLESLKYPKTSCDNREFLDILDQFRERIDALDYQLLELLSKRMHIVEQIGEYKLQNEVTIFQLRRWLNIIKTRQEFGQKIGLDEHFVKKLLQLVHRESIRKQTKIID